METDSKMRVTFLGTGTSCGVPRIGCRCEVCTSTDPHDSRLRCSALFQQCGTNILLDCSPDFRYQMLRARFSSAIHAVFITHEHYDHVGGLDDLRPFRGCPSIPMTMPPGTCVSAFPIAWCVISTPAYRSSRCTFSAPLTSIRVMHGQLPILGYRVGDVGYITDMTTMPPESLPLLDGIRLLVVNALRHTPHPTHQSLEQAIAFRRSLQGNFPTYFIHMADQIGLHAQQEALLPDGFHLAYDGLELTV